ncbi:ABC transporter ATP-binding protein [Paracraurococcus ruber]|uniref:Peptide ABC transporter ATP-binding protein n=1 Tax=Paracraurococcus ruber TaxID=77675 RepID=A0ABS1CRM7_9PROT|nr:ABC transporter ATP-binding protein [Paracraurococcus ruber]MBK1657018.1 peptide ABC transporter ATP-binding protein [Paracraurococcus ruber]TDG34286.1 ABC transporter ATP-binding protein [Paracraurococcus ruber]
MSEPLLEVEGLRKHFVTTKGLLRRRRVTVRAVEDVSFAIGAGEAFGLVGESGCGKSTAARALLRLIEPDAGGVRWRGEDVLAARGARLKALRRRMQIIFQDPYSALDPRQRIGAALTEPMRVHAIASGAEARRRAAALLDEVGLPPAVLDRYPHEFSGGQRQRIGIARALTLEPELIVADEPVSALDVSVQAQVLLLLRELRRRRGLAFLFVSHDLSVVRWFCDRVAVMYLGRIVEEGPAARVLAQPLHPYAQMLRDASPVPDPARRGTLPRIRGEIPSAAAPPPGCPFHPRCPQAIARCTGSLPRWTALPAGQGGVACHLHG